ncbi:lysophospholipid acyltransferase family protein [Endozoicomonas arenosclerae]|uniref:lysophospholipid acyltransferase family protein n=1 Tax=Endozoicomonas arenosclerae TaxID=1633495 RepID=UPI000780C0AF|nr:lysophospholipid acyltransferase family protein [Endozoicomonas arenosclerae]
MPMKLNCWKNVAANYLVRLLTRIPKTAYSAFSLIFSYALRLQKNHIARASIQQALPYLCEKKIKQIIRQSARHTVDYVLALPQLDKQPYQLNHQDVLTQALAENKGAIIISLHMGPPDLGTMAATQIGIPTTTLIGAGKHSPLTHTVGKGLLKKVGIDPIAKGDPTVIFQLLKQKKAIFLYNDLRSREMPVTFFGHETQAPASGIMTAQLLNAPVLFHYCTLEHNEWQLHFERIELSNSGNRKEDAQHNLQQIIHRMEQVIREHPELWIWHYDRFQLKKKVSRIKGLLLTQPKPDLS